MEKQAHPNVFGSVLNAALEMERPVVLFDLDDRRGLMPLLSLSEHRRSLFADGAHDGLALGGALLFALFLVPVLASIFFRHGYTEWENPSCESRGRYTPTALNLLFGFPVNLPWRRSFAC